MYCLLSKLEHKELKNIRNAKGIKRKRLLELNNYRRYRDSLCTVRDSFTNFVKNKVNESSDSYSRGEISYKRFAKILDSYNNEFERFRCVHLIVNKPYEK